MGKFIGLALSVFLSLSTAQAAERKGKILKHPRTKIPTQRTVNYNPERLVVLRGEVDDSTARPVIDRITKLDRLNPTAPVYLIINTPGGSVTSGAEIIQVMQSTTVPITCMIETEAFSMGALIAAYCDKVYIHKFAMMMFHEAQYGVQGSETMIKTRVAATQKFLDQIFADVALQLGLTLPEFRKLIKNELWLSANESVSMGLADAIIEELKYEYTPPPGASLPFFLQKAREDEVYIYRLDTKL